MILKRGIFFVFGNYVTDIITKSSLKLWLVQHSQRYIGNNVCFANIIFYVIRYHRIHKNLCIPFMNKNQTYL